MKMRQQYPLRWVAKGKIVLKTNLYEILLLYPLIDYVDNTLTELLGIATLSAKIYAICREGHE